jgi:flagellar assembly protein FliH
MPSETNEGKLTAWERWELASFDQPDAAETRAQDEDVIRPPSVEEIEHIHQQAHEAGHAAGYAAGYAEGQACAREESARLGVLVTQLESALSEFDQQVAEGLLALALDVARQVIRQTIAVKPQVLLETIHEALSQMPHPHATIHLNPEDASLVRSYLGEQLAHAGHRIHEDQRLERGGCLIEANGSQIDASLTTRWRRAVESLGSNAEWLEPASARETPAVVKPEETEATK